jgi:hypothetical protein
MCFVDNDQIEMPDAEPTLALRGLVDKTHHRRIGRDIRAALCIPLCHQVDRCRGWQVTLEGIDGLPYERYAVGRNSTRFTQLARISKSASAITVRVFPAPVAITRSALRWLSFSNDSVTRTIARA